MRICVRCIDLVMAVLSVYCEGQEDAGAGRWDVVSICVCVQGCVRMYASVVGCVLWLCAAMCGIYRACDGSAIGVL